MKLKLCAFDLDGTLLNSQKKLSEANRAALQDMVRSGIVIALASGRLGSSMIPYVPELGVNVAMLTLNGAAVFMDASHGSRCIYQAPLDHQYADYLVKYAVQKEFALNYYLDGKLYTVKNERLSQWTDLYYSQTRTLYNFLDDFKLIEGSSPSKIIFVGDEKHLDQEETLFRNMWNGTVYICRTWNHYLEFLSPGANKGDGLAALARAYNIDMSDVIAFGDANNDIPMLQRAGLGIAMGNAESTVKESASHVSPWTNDEDAIAKEWDRIKQTLN